MPIPSCLPPATHCQGEHLDLQAEVNRLKAKVKWLDEKLDRLWDVVMEMKR